MRLVIVVLMVLCGQARAEMWASSMGELMRDAASIELVQVDSIKDGVVTGKLVEAMRSKRAKGSAITVALGRLATPVVGDRVLVVCDSECPRAAGVLRDGWVQLRAQQPMDGAVVYPSVVVASSIPVLMAGRPAPNLCVRGTIALVDDPQRPVFEAQVSAGDGKGTATVDKSRVPARVGGAWGHSDDDITVELGSLAIATDTLKRAGGCLVGELAPVPAARTRKAMDQAIAGKRFTQVLARGTLVVGKGGKVAAGRHAFKISADGNGQVIVTSPLVTGANNRIGYSGDKLQLGFSVSPKDFYPAFELELVIGKRRAGGPSSQLVAVLAKQRSIQVRVAHLASAKSGVVTTPIGVMTLDYVPDR